MSLPEIPRLRRKAPVPFTDAVKIAYLGMLAKTGLVAKSAELVGISRSAIYKEIRQDKDFAALFIEARELYRDSLVEEATRRALGYREPIVYQGKITGDKTVYSERLLELLLRTVGGLSEKTEVDVTIKAGVLAIGTPIVDGSAWRDAANRVEAPHRTLEENE